MATDVVLNCSIPYSDLLTGIKASLLRSMVARNIEVQDISPDDLDTMGRDLISTLVDYDAAVLAVG